MRSTNGGIWGAIFVAIAVAIIEDPEAFVDGFEAGASSACQNACN